MALFTTGFMRRWPANGTGAAVSDVLQLGSDDDDGALLDVDAAPDGSVVVLGGGSSGGVARVRPDGTAQRLGTLTLDPYERASVAALPDGGAWVAASEGLLRIDANGTVVRRVRQGFSGFEDVAALPDGNLAVAQSSYATVSGRSFPGLVLRVDESDRITVLAGGGRGFKDGARATDVDLGDVWAVARLRDEAILIGSERGLLRLDRDGRIHRLVGGGAETYVAADDRRAVNDDGQRAGDVRLTQISRIDTLDGEHPLVLTEVPGPDESRRLALIAPIDRIGRLAVALPRANRELLRRGRVELLATGPATARVELLRGRRVVTSKTVSLRDGRTRTRLRVPHSNDAHVLRVVATTPQGAIATHRLTFIPSRLLASRIVTRIEDAISLLGVSGETDASVACRRRTSRRFACVIYWSTVTSHGVLRLRDDGLISFRGPRVGPRRRPRVNALNLVFEPLTFNPRPG